mgnify:CR=1 FL=1
MNLLLFPNQLFHLEYLPKNITKIYLIEHPLFFGKREKQYKFNKLKLILHCASMQNYKELLQKKGFSIQYVSYHDFSYQKFPKTNVNCFEVNDHLLEKELKKYNSKINFLPSPNFLLSMQDLDEYHEKNKSKKLVKHQDFYIFVRNKLNILKNSKTYDAENRKKIPSGTNIPSLPKVQKNKFITNATHYVNKHFSENYGSTNLLYPICHIESKKWFQDFLKNKLQKFGEYQDAIVGKEDFLFHSVISPMLNIGLLSPKHIVQEIEKYYSDNKSKIGINNYEGFIRQIIGWREYQRYCYHFYYKEMTTSNIFGNSRCLNSKWYNGSLGIKPVDDAIKMAFEYGYLHHILRLMIMTNFMNLCGIQPKEVYRWFMEFSVDSYDWVMIQNVYSMGMWADGGLTMRKPYISADNYVLNMSNYTCKENWCPIWKSLYYVFLEKHQTILRSTPYGRNLAVWSKKSKEEKAKMLKLGQEFLKTI